METVKKIWFRVLDFLGLKRDTKYVNRYLNDANMHSAIFMSAIIAILEFALVFRQHDKYIIPSLAPDGSNYWQLLFDNTSLFWLMMTFGISMFCYAIFYESKKLAKWKLIVVLAFAALGLLFCFQLPFESSIRLYMEKCASGAVIKYKAYVQLILLIILYIFVFLFHVLVIVSTIMRYKGKKIQWLHSIAVITLFATVCLVFGVRVSFSDFFSTSSEKSIICFLMFSIYVGCLLIWKPYISIGVLGAIFLGFYFLLESNTNTDPEHIKRMSEGDQVNYMTFFISLAMICVSIFNQRTAEARKDERLETLATVDTLTGLHAFEYFVSLCLAKYNEDIIDKYVYIFIDISSFKTFNEKRGFEAGNIFLKDIAGILRKYFPKDLVTRQGDDHFVVFARNIGIEEKLDAINREVGECDLDIRPGIIAGANVVVDKSEDPHLSIEKARFAVDSIKNEVGVIYSHYDEEMHKKYLLMQYIVHHIDEAIEKGYIKPYYQPVVYAQDETLCGFEALTRWIDPEYGFMNPGVFIGVLEDAQLIYKLDFAMLDLVCKDIRRRMDELHPVVPVSINFSRVDFLVTNAEEKINEIIEQYNIPKDYIHVEITESALNDQADDLKASLKRIKDNGLAIWLDDFGSGYSSFNALKDYDFDVLKLDLEFLKGFDRNPKSKLIIKSVIDMANALKLRTLSEGVETKEQAAFLKEIGCLRLQGYLYGKPEPYDIVAEKMINGFFKVAENPFK